MLGYLRSGNKRIKAIWWTLTIVTVLSFLIGFSFMGSMGRNAGDARQGNSLGSINSERVTNPMWVRYLGEAQQRFVQSYGTAWFALHRRARAQAGEWLLVLGAGGGIGLAAVDVGRAMGLHVIAAASSEAKRELALSYGAEATIDTSTEDVKTRAKELSGGGVHIVYDSVGGALAEAGLRALRDDGQLLVLGFAGGEIPKLPANQILLRNRRVTGVDWGGWVGGHQKENAAMLAEVLTAIEAGQLRPVEPKAYPLADVAVALQDQVDRRVVGKSVLVP